MPAKPISEQAFTMSVERKEDDHPHLNPLKLSGNLWLSYAPHVIRSWPKPTLQLRYLVASVMGLSAEMEVRRRRWPPVLKYAISMTTLPVPH
jgi:hypothetical protein